MTDGLPVRNTGHLPGDRRDQRPWRNRPTQLAERGGRVLVGARSERGDGSADRIRSRVPDADLQVAVADLSLMQEVRSLAYQIMDSTRVSMA